MSLDLSLVFFSSFEPNSRVPFYLIDVLCVSIVHNESKPVVAPKPLLVELEESEVEVDIGSATMTTYLVLRQQYSLGIWKHEELIFSLPDTDLMLLLG